MIRLVAKILHSARSFAGHRPSDCKVRSSASKSLMFNCTKAISVLVIAILLSAIELNSYAHAANPVATENLQRQARQFISIVREKKQFSDDLLVNAYVIDLAKRLAESADLDIDPLHYYVVRDPAVNAFAGPGATFFLNSGLIELTSNEGELVSVMAHELAHFKQDHLNRLIQAYESTQVPSILAVLAGILIGGDAGIAAIVGSQAARVESVIEHTLAYEREADNTAVRMMAATGYNPIHAKNFMESLEREIRERGVVQSNIHNTHPVTPERIAAIDARLRRFADQSFPEFTSDFLYFKARNRVLFHWEAKKTYLHFERNLSKGSEAERLATHYGYALALAKDGNMAKARAVLDELISHQPDNLWIVLALAELKLAENPAEVVSALNPWAIAESPNPAVIHLYTRALLQVESAEQANRYLRKHLAANPEHIQLLALNAQTAAQAGAVGEAYLADADYHFKIGDLRVALGQLKYAEQNSKDFITMSIAQEKIRQVSSEIAWRNN